MTKGGQIMRRNNTDRNGNRWSDQTKSLVWSKATPITGENPSQYRLDACNAIIEWGQFGVTNDYGTGWEIDHIHPVALNGSDSISNLQPLQWQNNRRKGDSVGTNYCAVSRI